MIASLPMYDWPETAAANDRLWALVRDALRGAGLRAPDALTRGGDPWDHWRSADLVLSQTCGLPYRARLHGRVTLIGTPDYGVEGCPPGYYRSVLIARTDDPREGLAAFREARMAINEGLSQSGWGAPWEAARDMGLTLTPATVTGGHIGSARAVADGDADFAAIDAVSWRLMTRHRRFTDGLRAVGATRPTPGLPLISAPGADAPAIAAAIGAAIAGLGAEDRDTLGLRGLARIAAGDYLAVPVPPDPPAVCA